MITLGTKRVENGNMVCRMPEGSTLAERIESVIFWLEAQRDEYPDDWTNFTANALDEMKDWRDLTTRRHNRSAQPDINTADLLFREVRPTDAAVLIAQLERLPGANRVSVFASGSWRKCGKTSKLPQESTLLAQDAPVDLHITASGIIQHEGVLYVPAPDATGDPSRPHVTIALNQEGA